MQGQPHANEGGKDMDPARLLSVRRSQDVSVLSAALCSGPRLQVLELLINKQHLTIEQAEQSLTVRPQPARTVKQQSLRARQPACCSTPAALLHAGAP